MVTTAQVAFMSRSAQVAFMSRSAQAPLPAAAPARPSQLELDLLVAAVRAEHADLTGVLDRWFGPVPAHPTVGECGLCTCHFLACYDDLTDVESALARVFAPAVHAGVLTLSGYGFVVLELLGRQCEPGSTFVIADQIDAIRDAMPAAYPRRYPVDLVTAGCPCAGRRPVPHSHWRQPHGLKGQSWRGAHHKGWDPQFHGGVSFTSP